MTKVLNEGCPAFFEAELFALVVRRQDDILLPLEQRKRCV